MAEDAFVTDFEHIMADDITDDVRFIMYDSASGKTASAGEVSKYMTRNIHVDTTLTEEGAAADAKAVGDALATKADTKGRYEDIVAGGAEQLMADGYETDKDPYLFRPTGGSADVGNREYVDKIVGGTVAWNQLYKRGNSGTNNGIVVTLKSDDYTINLDGTATSNAYIVISDAGIATEYTTVIGHKYLVYKSAKKTGVIVYNDNGGVYMSDNANYTIGEATKRTKFYCRVLSGTTLSNFEVYFQIHDLTAMFGTTIADYIYSLEQSQAGAGVAWFRNYFPKDYYPYDNGTLRSVEGVSAHEMVGKNLLPPSTTKTLSGIKYTVADDGRISISGTASAEDGYVIPFTVQHTGNYYFSGCADNGSFSKYDVYVWDSTNAHRAYKWDGATSSDSAIGSGDKEIYLESGITYQYRIRVRNSFSASSQVFEPMIRLASINDATYEPYAEPTTYPLDSSLTLRGIPKLVDGKLAFDGDVYPPSGEVQRRYGTATFNGSSSESWFKSSSALNGFYISMSALGMKEYGTVVNSYGYPQTFRINDYFNNYGRVYTDYTFGINIDPSLCGSTVESFKTYLASHPITIVYELATPTTETAEGYEQYQICDPSGTEEFVTTGIVPVGHETRYPHDLKKKIETAPDSPSTDGTYLMKRSGGKNTYMALPSTPSANGAYVLTVTVSGGTASYSWTAKG